MIYKRALIVGTFIALYSLTAAGQDYDDPLAPRSSPDNALTSPLKAVSMVTNSLQETRRFYEDGMGLTCSKGELSDDIKRIWRLANDGNWQLHSCTRPQTSDGIEVRLLSSDLPGKEVRSDFDVKRNGIMSLGFAISGIEAHEEKMVDLGYPTNDGITTITLPTTSGGTYVVKESHYKGPHNSYNLGIERPEGFDSVAAVDANSGLGGPAYSAMMVPDADVFKAFMEDVLGYEARRDIEFESSGPGGGLIGIEKGTKLRFIQMYSPGSTSNYMIVMSVGDLSLPASAEILPPNLGLMMMTYETSNFDKVASRMEGAEVTATSTLVTAKGDRRVTFRAPNGTLIEIIETGNKVKD